MTGSSILQCVRMQGCACTDYHILLAIQFVGHRSIAGFIIEFGVPQNFPCDRIECNEVARWIASEKQPASGCENPGEMWLTLARIDVLPANLAGLITHGNQS